MNKGEKCNHQCPHCCPVEYVTFDSNDGFDVGALYYEIAKRIEGTRILGEGGYTTPLSYCEVVDENEVTLVSNWMNDDTEDFIKAKELFEYYFSPQSEAEKYVSGSPYWWCNPGHNTEEQHNARILACLFFAEMVGDEDLVDIPND